MLQVTKAMEMIASIKMKKAQDRALQSKHYVFESWRAILDLSRLSENRNNQYLSDQKNGKILVLIIASDRGLAGSYNNDILRQVIKFSEEHGLENIDFVTMGEKAKNFVRKIGGKIVADFPLGEQIRFTFVSPAALIAWDSYTEGRYKKFYSIHTHFDSAVRKSATTLQILPLEKPANLNEIEAEDNDTEIDFKFEPTKTEVLNTIIRQTVRALTYQVILESEAAEHASRMIAMKNASDAARDLKEDFEFTFNQVRQASITSELAEISAGAIAQE